MHAFFRKLTATILSSISQERETAWHDNTEDLREELQSLNKQLSAQSDLKESLGKILEHLVIIRESSTKTSASSEEPIETAPEYLRCSKSLTALNRKILATVETLDAKFEIRSKDENIVKNRISILNNMIES